MVDAETLKKTAYGLIPTFGHVFKNAHYVPHVYTPGVGGTIAQHAPGDLFISTSRDRDLLPECVPHGKVLSATPVIELPKFFPRIGSNSRELSEAASIQIIAWRKHGVFLILAGDPNHIRDAWLGFIPMDQRFTVSE